MHTFRLKRARHDVVTVVRIPRVKEQTMAITSRRRFLKTSSALVGTSLLPYASLVRADPPPEIKKLRLIRIPAICHAPQYVAEAMLKLEGFTELEYRDYPAAGPDGIAMGRVDMSMWGANRVHSSDG